MSVLPILNKPFRPAYPDFIGEAGLAAHAMMPPGRRSIASTTWGIAFLPSRRSMASTGGSSGLTAVIKSISISFAAAVKWLIGPSHLGSGDETVLPDLQDLGDFRSFLSFLDFLFEVSDPESPG